jgi:hypothetical protein
VTPLYLADSIICIVYLSFVRIIAPVYVLGKTEEEGRVK